MRLIRVAAPALIGALFLLMAVQATATGIGQYGESFVHAFRGGLLPAALGIALLLSALAIARRSRAGYLLGFVVASVMVLAGLVVFALEIPFIGKGGISGAVAIPLMTLSVVWCLLWVAYGWSFRRSRATFAATSTSIDRRVGIVLAALALFSAGAYVSLGAIESDAVANQSIDQARAAALVADTSFKVDVVDVRVGTPSGTGTGQPVEHLTLDVSISSATSYLLSTGPLLCLTDVATYQDPAFKPDVYCWGTPDPDTALLTAFGGGPITADGTRVRLELDRGGALCPFEAGAWNAELRLAPQLGATPGGGVGPIPETYTVTTLFEVASGTVVPPETARASCIEASVSP